MPQLIASGETLTELLIQPRRLKELIEETVELTMMPAVAMEAIKMSDDSECSISDLVNVIKKDRQLLSDIVFLCNRSMHKPGRNSKGIEQAIAGVGIARCHNLIICSSFNSLVRKLPPTIEWARDLLWRHCLQTATIASQLNTMMRLGFDGEEFAGGMLHDLGRLLIRDAAPDVFEIVDRLTFCEPESLLEYEECMMGTNHCEIGACFAEAAGWPASLVDVIRHHHTPLQGTSNTWLTTLVSAADHMANHLLYAGSVDNYDPSTNPALKTMLTIHRVGCEQEIIDLSNSALRAAEAAIVGPI